MNIRIAAAKALALVGRDGVAATARRALWYASGRKFTPDPFDTARATDTSGETPPWKLGAHSANERFAEKYQASSAEAVVEAVAFAKVVPSSLTFIDLGCGKGRTLIIAAELGFKQVIGVEFAPALVDIAKVNLDKLVIQNASVLRLDAATYSFPDEDFVLYMYNPFRTEVMSYVVNNLRLVQTRAIFIIYARPLCSEMFDRCDFLTRLGSPPNNAEIVVWTTMRGIDHSRNPKPSFEH
jgi:SAM-dependent methyltransferase